ncbi:FtsW/RodA/SpoVE family cell cycle protein [Clostridium intestinale]|uniref:FtsW/RodA/SpoVE family cell cycle protein n=1 Tax=Clostridium intestinale TaxID=36845 RepID=A0A7D6ZIE2_9CLOT|nr:FtsW/RodA/SpoVE family cell cycle protein [Clostridium intestinale]QLY81261.1 FtsW/RodA/SpoVE family cell cycle protein [Clostridium intestinale]
MKLKLENFIPLIISIPAVTIGVIAMYYNKIPPYIWAQNIFFLVIAGLISSFVTSIKLSTKKNSFYGIYILISLLFIILTFVNPGIDGVHRWISIGIIKFNVSMIVLPILIIELWKLSKIKGLSFTIVVTIVISILLLIQPDASELTAFAIPMMVMLYAKTDKKVLRSFIVGILSILIIISWVFLDNLPPVSYVEGILSLLANMGLIWLILGVLSLIILPVPFILFPPKHLKLPSTCLGLYFMLVLISTLFGNFPVPLMGYGISPIISYFISITWYTKSSSIALKLNIRKNT